MYMPAAYANIRIPNVKDDHIRQVLADCWEQTKDTEVRQFRDGECEVRRLWDEAVAEAMGWDAGDLAHLRHLLHQEPHVRGLGYGSTGMRWTSDLPIANASKNWPTNGRAKPYCCLTQTWQPNTLPIGKSSAWRTRRAPDSGKDAVAERTLVPRTTRNHQRQPHEAGTIAVMLERCRPPGWNGVSAMDTLSWADLFINEFPNLGGIFDPHGLERENPDVNIPDTAFQQIFRFFDQYQWDLDDRPTDSGDEINPDVLGYIFEKYVNQKQMGAYYTKEDITGYIARNTVIPGLLE